MKRRRLLRYGAEAAGVATLGVGAVESGVLSGDSNPTIRPPGGQQDEEFLSNCIKCGRCIQTCPPNALDFAGFDDGLLGSGSPELTPESAGCIAWDEPCLECIDACPTDSLAPIPTGQDDIPTETVIGRAQIDEQRCINCGNCPPACPVDAVLAQGTDGRSTYSIDYEACVGCGKCIEICPVDGTAIELFEPDAAPAYPITMEDDR